MLQTYSLDSRISWKDHTLELERLVKLNWVKFDGDHTFGRILLVLSKKNLCSVYMCEILKFDVPKFSAGWICF